MGQLEGKVALVLGAGAANNIGQSIAARFAAEGAAVMVAGRNDEELARFAAQIGGDSWRCDITNEDDLAALVDQTRRRFGGLDIAVNATGLNQLKPLLDVTRAELEQVVEVQFVGTFLFMQAVLRGISDGGSIIQISSVTASALMPNHAAYMATKAAGDVLVRSAAAEFGRKGVRVNSIAPAATEGTPMARAALADETIRARIRKTTPLGRIGTTDDVAEAAVWLASDGNFITGEVLQVNGGAALHQLG